MDKNGKILGKISIFDLIVLALVIVVAIGTFYKYHSEATNIEGGQTTIEYTVRILGVRWFTIDYYSEGLLCFDTKSGEEIGVIKAVRSRPYSDFYQDVYGGVDLLEVPEMIEIELDIETMGLETDRGYFARGSYELKAGSEIFLSTKYVDVTGSISEVGTQ